MHYDKSRCIHAAECGRGLHPVFNGQNTPWIQPDAAHADEVAKVVTRCPTGALVYKRLDGGPAEAPSPVNTVFVAPHGPLYVRGDLVIRRADGTEEKMTRVALCRCGASQNKPFCDDAHLAAGFKDAGPVAADPKGDAPQGGTLTVLVSANGSLVFNGPMILRTGTGRDASYASRAGMCRCGASSKKPYCDGTHVKIAFKAE